MSLYELEPFAGLEAVAREFRVRFRLHGGTASRLWMRREFGLPDGELADLAPYTSDIDLDHDGDDALTPAILAAIDELTPGACWCRWTVRGRAAAAAQARRKAESTRIPLRDISFTAGPFSGAEDAFEDLLSGQVSVHPSAWLAEPHAGRPEDLEIFGLLVAFNAAADLMNLTGEAAAVDPDVIEGFVRRHREHGDDRRLSDSPALQRRAQYLTAAIVARVWPPPENMRPVLASLVRRGAPSVIPGTDEAAVVSAALADGGYRVSRGAKLEAGDDGGELAALLESSGFRLDPVFSLRAVSAPLKLAAGEAPSSGATPMGGRREFLHLAWLGDAPAGALGGLALSLRDGLVDTAGRGAAAGGRFPLGANWLRLDIGDLAPTRAATEVRIAILEAAIPEEDIAPETPRSRSGGSGDEAVIAEAEAAQTADEDDWDGVFADEEDDERIAVVET